MTCAEAASTAMAAALNLGMDHASLFEHHPPIHPKQGERASHYQFEFKIPYPVHIAIGGYCSRFAPLHPRLTHQVAHRCRAG